jgi:hypothetical protein
VPIRGFNKGTDQFPIQKCAIFCKFKEIKELRGGVLLYAAQAIPPIDAEIAEKGHLWTETNYDPPGPEEHPQVGPQTGSAWDGDVGRVLVRLAIGLPK